MPELSTCSSAGAFGTTTSRAPVSNAASAPGKLMYAICSDTVKVKDPTAADVYAAEAVELLKRLVDD